MKDFYKQHQKVLKEKLDEIYTIKTPEDYPLDIVQNVNIEEELLRLSTMLEVYSVLDKGLNQGAIFEEYKNYLDNVENGIRILKREKNVVEKENESDITNSRLMLEVIERKLNN